MGADPICYSVCQYKIEMDVFTISDALKSDFHEWVSRFGECIDVNVLTRWKIKEEQHNSEGDFFRKVCKLGLVKLMKLNSLL